jgi:hypothetical protein
MRVVAVRDAETGKTPPCEYAFIAKIFPRHRELEDLQFVVYSLLFGVRSPEPEGAIGIRQMVDTKQSIILDAGCGDERKESGWFHCRGGRLCRRGGAGHVASDELRFPEDNEGE